MVAPFERIFGDTDELRIIEFLLSTEGLEFEPAEISRATHISNESIVPILQKLVFWGMLTYSNTSNKYSINRESRFIKAVKQIDKLLRRILSRKKNRPYSGWAITDSAFCDWLDTEEDEAWKDL